MDSVGEKNQLSSNFYKKDTNIQLKHTETPKKNDTDETIPAIERDNELKSDGKFIVPESGEDEKFCDEKTDSNKIDLTTETTNKISAINIHPKPDEDSFEGLKNEEKSTNTDEILENSDKKNSVSENIYDPKNYRNSEYSSNYYSLNGNQKIHGGQNTRSKNKLRIFGLDNYGNTCYINSVLQILINSKEFIFNLREARSSIGKCIHELSQSTEENRSYYLEKFLASANNIDKRWADSLQRDSKDFFLSILTNMLNQGDEKVTRVFYGVKTSIYTMNCSHEMKVDQNFGFLNAGKQTIRNYFENSLGRFIDEQQNNPPFEFICEEHNLSELCTEKRMIKLPKILGIYFDNEHKQTLNCVQYKNVQTNQHELELCGVIQRLGYGKDYGHYKAYYFIDNQWFRFDDGLCDSYNQPFIESAYMIFYKILS